MKPDPFFNPVRMVILVLILLSFQPLLLWLVDRNDAPRVVVAGPADITEERQAQLLWPFLYRKGTIHNNLDISSDDTQSRDYLFILTASLPADVSDREALLAVDRVKETALESRNFICDGYTLSETIHSQFRNRLENFLQIKWTGWVIRYERDEGARLVFSHDDQEDLVLEGGLHFSGKPPEVKYDGRRAAVYSWIPLYEASGEGVVTATVDLKLTEEGRALLSGRRIPEEVPLIIESKTPLIQTGFFSVNMKSWSLNTGSYKAAGKLTYKSRISLYTEDTDEALYWRTYVPWIEEQMETCLTGRSAQEISLQEETAFFIKGRDFYLKKPGAEEERYFIKGVNLGAALPGTWFTQFPEDEHIYYRWFGQMKGINLNTVRIYTLFPPSFYRAFRKYNENHRDDPLYLIQEIWPEEHPHEENFLGEGYNRAYQEEIYRTVDALHGNRFIETREGRAWGNFTADITPWLQAWLVGREMEPQEVEATNSLNRGYVYRGHYVSAPKGPATEAWLAECCDRVVCYEMDCYGTTRPVGIVSWPILDVLHHQVEWNDPELAGKEPRNDKVAVDINRITLEDDSFGGFFGAYHIYPNYPDFMNNQSSYEAYEDGQGTFRYGGYLKDFMVNHGAYPALVAEYGISTSAATAHFSPDGYHHGGLTETEQAEGIIRMTDAIRREGYAGAVIFEWIDEWAKKTWTTEPFMVPYDRQALWRNVLDPEQNYGIMAMVGTSVRGQAESRTETGFTTEVWGSESHLYLRLSEMGPWEEGDSVLFGLDTYDREGGAFLFPGLDGQTVPTGMECLAQIEPLAGTGRILTPEDYNLSTLSLDSTPRRDQPFRRIEILVNRAFRREDGTDVPAQYADWSELRFGPLDEAGHSLYRDDTSLTVRIPWGLLNVSDPSGGSVLDDPRDYTSYPERDVIGTADSDEIRIYGVILRNKGEEILSLPDLIYRWDEWDVPGWIQEEKKSVRDLREYFKG